MTNTDSMSIVSWTLLGIVLNVLFLGHGIVLMSTSVVGSNLGMLGAATTVYAAGTSLLLLAAWLSPLRAVLAAAALLTAAYIVLIVIVALRIDVVRGFEWLAGVVLLVGFILANLVAIERVRARALPGGR